ncbi:MAG: hypothetical protein E7130_05830 [Rikenellaceae bacterium]|nr:hypothetical protein [Rikenellaceae bacterium]
MIFTSIPDNYTPVTHPLIYRFAFDEEQEVVDVQIIDARHSRTLGIKRLYNVLHGEIDIAPMLAETFCCEYVEGGTLLGVAEGLFATIVVQIGDIATPIRYFSPYPVMDGVGTIFRISPKVQRLFRGESDFVVLYAPNGGFISCESYHDGEVVDVADFMIDPDHALQIFKLSTADCAEMADEIIVQFNLDGVEDFQTYRVVPKPESTHRLVWLASDGSLQLYTFPTCRSRRLAVQKQRVVSSDGVVVASAASESSLTLVSDYETTAEIERLGEIIESKQVWLERGTKGVKVDVLSSESVVRYGGSLNSLQIEIRPCDRKERLL